MADELTIKVVSGGAEDLRVRVNVASASVLHLKQQIEQKDARRFPVAGQRLIFQGQILQNDKKLCDYNVTPGCALHVTLAPQTENPSYANQLLAFLEQMRASESQDKYATAILTLQKICSNIVSHPAEEKYRKLRTENAALRAKLFDRNRGIDCIKLLGFQDDVQSGHMVLVPTPEKWENLVECKNSIDRIAQTLSSSPASRNDVAAQAPAMMQSVANSSMMQQLASQNPMVAQVLQNPSLLTQSLQTLQQNPNLLAQMSQMMADPSALQQLLGGSSATANPFAPVSPSPSSAATASSVLPPSGASSGHDASEEDEIAAAIARSLHDQ